MDYQVAQSLRPPNTAKHLPLEEFGAAFEDFSAKVRHRIFKLERLQNYIEEDVESWREFRRGNIRKSLELMREMRAKESRYDIDFFRRGLQFLRVHAVELPLSTYLKWEIQTYIISAQYGETILVTDITDADRNGLVWNSRDFLLFDSFGVLVHDYDSTGLLLGGWVCQDETFIKQCAEVAHLTISVSVPLAVFLDEHPSSSENPIAIPQQAQKS